MRKLAKRLSWQAIAAHFQKLAISSNVNLSAISNSLFGEPTSGCAVFRY